MSDDSATKSEGPLDCDELVELVTDYLEGGLAPLARRRFENHLQECEGCAIYLDPLRETLRQLGAISTDTLSPEATNQLMEAFRTWRGLR
jgi:anti-sigma factor RsiW